MERQEIEELVTQLSVYKVGDVIRESDLRALAPVDLTDLQWSMALWTVREQMREKHKLEFIRRSGVLTIATAKQCMDKGVRMQRSGVRKVGRGLKVLNVADELQLNQEDREKLDRARARGGRMYTLMLAELRSRKPDPASLPTTPIPPDPRRTGT